MKQIRDELRSATASVIRTESEYEKILMSVSDIERESCLKSNLKEHELWFRNTGIDISGYIADNFRAGAYKRKTNDYSLVLVQQLLEKMQIDTDDIRDIFRMMPSEVIRGLFQQRPYSERKSFYQSGSSAVGIDELKLGLEKSLNIREIAMLAGADRKDTHDNILIFARYADFFRNRIEFSSMAKIREFINSIRLGALYNPQHMVFHARNADDIEKRAPIIKVDQKIAVQIETGYAGANRAFYYQDGDLFICKHLRSGKEYATKDEGSAMSWVCKRNYDIAPRTKQVQLSR